MKAIVNNKGLYDLLKLKQEDFNCTSKDVKYIVNGGIVTVEGCSSSKEEIDALCWFLPAEYYDWMPSL